MYDTFRDYLSDRWTGVQKRECRVMTLTPYDTAEVSSCVTDQGLRKIENAIWDHTGLDLNIPDAFDRALTTSSGRITKRIDRWFYGVTGKWMSKEYPQLLATIGEIASRNSVKADESITVDFDNTLRWRTGAYGDDGSCFWSNRTHDRAVLRDYYKAWAMRMYEPWHDDTFREIEGNNRYYAHWQSKKPPVAWPKGYIGFARCWMLPDIPDKWSVFITNFYGNHSEKFAITLCLLLEELTGNQYTYENKPVSWDDKHKGPTKIGSRMYYYRTPQFYVNYRPLVVHPVDQTVGAVTLRPPD